MVFLAQFIHLVIKRNISMISLYTLYCLTNATVCLVFYLLIGIVAKNRISDSDAEALQRRRRAMDGMS
jgi:uncharacterized protein with PQ loop repeat